MNEFIFLMLGILIGYSSCASFLVVAIVKRYEEFEGTLRNYKRLLTSNYIIHRYLQEKLFDRSEYKEMDEDSFEKEWIKWQLEIEVLKNKELIKGE